MSKKIRYGDFINTMSSRQCRISYNHLTPKPKYDEHGREIPYRPPPLKLCRQALLSLLGHYLEKPFKEQIQAVLPIALGLILFQFLIIEMRLENPLQVAAGLGAVIIGLMLFMEGLKRGLMPFGEHIGDALPRKVGLLTVMIVVFILGIGVTFAEPAIGALKTAGSLVQQDKAPLLFALLNEWSDVLVLMVGAGVGLAAMLACLRLMRNWSLKPFIFATLVPLLMLTGYFAWHPELSNVIGLAWDCGAVTTGPVTVPLVLALGVGVAAATSKSTDPSGFGIVTLASLFPIIGVLLLALFIHSSGTLDTTAAVAAVDVVDKAKPWYEETPWNEMILGVRAIVPLIVFLFLVMWLVLRERMHNPRIIAYGLILAVIGMIIFNIGLTLGLSAVGEQTGVNLPCVFQACAGAGEETRAALYGDFGYVIALLFALGLGFGATLAEPALHAMGMTVENLTQGAFRKKFLIYAVSVGVAFGIMIGVIKLIADFSLIWILLPGYTLALILSLLANEEYVNIAWDSAGVTTGPVTVPLVLAMGLGLGEGLQVVEGFGILASASIGPIISVLTTGLWIEWQIKRSHRDEETKPNKNAAIDEVMV
jgi:hypothetical protein